MRAWLALPVIALACGQFLGEVDIETAPGALQPGDVPGAASLDAGVSDVAGDGIDEPSCEPGATRCDDGALQVCVRFDATRPAGWLTQLDCGSAELCQDGPPATCEPATCQTDEASCVGATPRLCNDSQTGWDELPACESAAHCSTLAAECPDGAPCCLVEPCVAGSLRCNEGRLEECQPDLVGWSPQATCESQELCLSGLAGCGAGASCTCEPPACDEGEVRCTGSTLERCNVGRTGWDLVSECGSAALCQLGLALAPPRCQEPECSPGQFTCDGATLRECRPDQTGFDVRGTCDGPAFCNATGGVCNRAPCDPGERSCNGAQIQVCAPDRSGFVPDGPPCATADLCNDNVPAAVRCDLPSCDTNQFNCFGTNQLQVCNAGRTGFTNAGPPCLRPDLCSAERRRCDFCVPSRQECTIDLLSTRVCAASGNFFGPETRCPLGCVAATGQCQTCNVGDYICTNGNLQRCGDGRSFTPLNRSTDCANGQRVSCVNGNVVRNNCPPRLSCGGTGQCVCTPGPAFCDGDDLLICNGTAIVAADQCQGAAESVLTSCTAGQLVTEDCGSAELCARSAPPACEVDGEGEGGGDEGGGDEGGGDEGGGNEGGGGDEGGGGGDDEGDDDDDD